MTNKLSGIYSTVQSSFVPDVPINYGAIFVAGHSKQSSGSVQYLSGAGFTDSDTWDASNTGTIYTWYSLADAQSTLGVITASGSNLIFSGTFGSGAKATYDANLNLLRSLELIYSGNPGAKVYGAILSGSGTDASTVPTGLSEALTASLVYKDISFVNDSGLEFNSTTLNHCVTASNQSNKAERMYIGGISLNDAYSGSTNASYDNVFGVSKYTNLRESDGRSLCFVGNVKHNFTIDGINQGDIEIGGNMFSSYIAGRLSIIAENTSLLNKNTNYYPRYNGKTKYWSVGELETNYDNSMLSIRFDPTNSPAIYFEKALTFAPLTATFTIITRRRIIDTVTKNVRTVLRTLISEPNISKKQTAGKLAALRALNSIYSRGLIDANFDANVYVNDGDAANGIVRAVIKVKPITEIMEIDLIIGVDL